MRRGGGAADASARRHCVEPAVAISQSSALYLEQSYRTAKIEWIARQKGSLRECRKPEQRKTLLFFFSTRALTSSLTADFQQDHGPRRAPLRSSHNVGHIAREEKGVASCHAREIT